MNRNELINRLSYMQDFSAVPQDFLDSLETRKNNAARSNTSSKSYNASQDRRFSHYLEYTSSREKGNDIFLAYVSFAIAANLSFHSMSQPSSSQISRMLQITGYTADEMEEYVWRENNIEPDLVPSPRLRQPVFILAHALEDALSDKSEWKHRKRTDVNPALMRLKKLTAYMQENDLLSYIGHLWKSDTTNYYEEFVLHHASFIVKRECISYELNQAFQLLKNRLEKADKDLDRTVMRYIKQMPAMSAPLANPSDDHLFDDLLRAVMSEDMPKEESDKILARGMAGIPPEMRTVLSEADKKRKHLTKSWSKILESADDMRDGIKADQEDRMRHAYLPSVAEDAFQAIVNGDDEIFKIKIGRYIWQDYMTQSNIAMPVVLFEKLEDEEEWDPIGTEVNGKLGLKIYDEDDLMTTRTESINGVEDVTLPLSSVLAKYAGRTISPHIYIRKSYMKMFREAGYSERKSRDFAVVLATLAEVNRIENADYVPERESVFEGGEITTGGDTETVATEEATADEKAAVEEDTEKAAADTDGKLEEAERQLKLAQKENQSCRHEIGILQRENGTLQRENSTLQREIERLQGLLKKKQETEEPSVPEEKIYYPYRTKLKVVVYGGFDVFHRELEKYIPGVRIVPAASKIDTAPIRNADIVFVQINKTDHSGYYTVCDACKGAGVPYIHLNYASAKRCAEVMVEEIRKVERAHS